MKIFFVILLAVGAFGFHVPSNSRIVGGEQAREGQFAYQVSVKYKGSHYCGGSVITPSKVLSAAHCFKDEQASDFHVNAGIIDINQNGQQRSVSSMSVHPEFSYLDGGNDIATLRLAGSLVYNDFVQPIPLETNFVGSGVEAVLSGWGRLSFTGELSLMLQYLHTITIENAVCNFENQHIGPVVDENICTLTKAGEGSCHGDSGSPLVSRGFQIGIMSWSEKCAIGKPDVFTRVSSYIDWIDDN